MLVDLSPCRLHPEPPIKAKHPTLQILGQLYQLQTPGSADKLFKHYPSVLFSCDRQSLRTCSGNHSVSV